MALAELKIGHPSEMPLHHKKDSPFPAARVASSCASSEVATTEMIMVNQTPCSKDSFQKIPSQEEIRRANMALSFTVKVTLSQALFPDDSSLD